MSSFGHCLKMQLQSGYRWKKMEMKGEDQYMIRTQESEQGFRSSKTHCFEKKTLNNNANQSPFCIMMHLISIE